MLSLHALALKQLRFHAEPDPLYRAVQLYDRADPLYKTSQQHTFHAFTSTTVQLDALQDSPFFDISKPRTIFVVGASSGFNIQAFSLSQHEKEVLLPLDHHLRLGAHCSLSLLTACHDPTGVAACVTNDSSLLTFWRQFPDTISHNAVL